MLLPLAAKEGNFCRKSVETSLDFKPQIKSWSLHAKIIMAMSKLVVKLSYVRTIGCVDLFRIVTIERTFP